MDWEGYMRKALALAGQAAALGEIPVGALVVQGEEIIGQGQNRREQEGDATAHAEILAIREACRHLGSWRLEGCTLFVTLEPCPMCTGAIYASRIPQVVFGAFDPVQGSCGSLGCLTDTLPQPRPALYGGVLEEECRALIQEFFSRKRENERKRSGIRAKKSGIARKSPD